MQVREKVEKSRNAVFFQGFVSAEGQKVGSLKRPGEMRDEKLQAIVARSSFGSNNAKTHLMLRALLEIEMFKKCTALWREARSEVKSVKNWRFWSTF